MITEGEMSRNGTMSNGKSLNGRGNVLTCPSDYEPRPAIDVVPNKPSPKWRDQLAPYTWSMSYTDSSSISHSVTLRGDTEEEVLEMVKPLVAGIRKAKAKGNSPTPDVPAETGNMPVCKIHGVQMERRVSKRTSAQYWAHGHRQDTCFGKAKS
jgi:hypothetical protein